MILWKVVNFLDFATTYACTHDSQARRLRIDLERERDEARVARLIKVACAGMPAVDCTPHQSWRASKIDCLTCALIECSLQAQMARAQAG